MIYHHQFPEKKPYDVRIWHCRDHYEHWHSNLDIYVCLEGQLDIRVEGTDYTLARDDVLLVAPNEIHQIFCDRSDTTVVLIAFGYPLLGSEFGSMQEIAFDLPFFSMTGSNISREITQPLSKIKEIMLNPHHQSSAVTDWMIRGNLYAIAAYLSNHSRPSPISKERQQRTKQLNSMHGVLNYISEHFHQPITVEMAAAISGYDRSYFCKQFRQFTGMTFHKYLNHYRICIACRYLSDSNVSISSVAERAGFTSAKMMSRLFQAFLGLTPTQYRALPLEQKNSIRPF